jgi:acetate kinase
MTSLLTVNAGSSSLRLAKYVLEKGTHCVGEKHYSPAPSASADVLVDFLSAQSPERPEMVIHRVVHGGKSLTEPCLIDQSVEIEIHRMRTLAPLHNDLALGWIRAAREAFGRQTLQAACFDTGFYAELPPPVAHYPLPLELSDQYAIRRYGFHGLAHQSMLNQWCDETQKGTDQRVISFQLGAGCSVTATRSGHPVETSMGFSPLEGLMMSTRCGDLDPAVVLHLITEVGLSPAETGRLLNSSSGLLGVSGLSGDMQELLSSKNKNAALAVSMFCHRARKYLGAYLAVLGGADALLFGGGIGEHAASIRARILGNFDWAGIQLDIKRNSTVSSKNGGPIHSDDSEVELWVIKSDEAQIMAEAGAGLLARSRNQSKKYSPGDE